MQCRDEIRRQVEDAAACRAANPAGAGAAGLHVVVQRCVRSRLLVDEAADEWTEIGRGLVLYVSFSNGLLAAAGASSSEGERLLRQAAKSLLSAPLASAGHWQADHSDAESVASLCRRGEPQGLLVVPQASLVAKLELGDRNLKYYQQCSKDEAASLYQAFGDALETVARELVCGIVSKQPKESWEELQAKRAAAAAVAPDEFFKVGDYEGKYSRFDADGIPTHDAAGEELAKSAVKKLQKIHAAQVKKFAKVSEGRAAAPVAATAASEGTDTTPSGESPCSQRRQQETELPPLPEGACLPTVRRGTFGGRQGFELVSAGPLTHAFTF